MATKARKPKEDDDVEGVRCALNAFDPDAAIGKFRMDEQISKLREARALPGNAHRNIRRAIYRAARSALSWKFHKTIRHPNNEAATRDFFAALREMVELNRSIQDYDVEQAFSVTHRDPHDGSADPPLLSFEEQTNRIENDIEAIRTSAAATASLIEKFARVTYIPEFKKDSSRTILFTHHFIQHVALHWQQMVGTPLCVEDLPHLTALIATALSDLDYPLSHSQRLSDDWLSDRIRKQICQNSSIAN
jgi:hypothetical protein